MHRTGPAVWFPSVELGLAPPQPLIGLTFSAMRRGISDHCVSCGLPFVMGPLFVDYIPQLRQRGLRATLGFEYRMYEDWFGHPRSDEWPAEVTLASCDSIYLGDVINSEMRCPKCGGFAFPEDDG